MTAKTKVLIGILLVAIVFFGGWRIWESVKIEKVPEKEIIEEETITEIEKQLRELEELRKEVPPLTEEEIESQVEGLEKLRQESQPLSQEETQKQLEELEKLRSQ